MKTLYRNIFLILTLALVACDTDVENIGYVPEHNVDYAALREYKASDHEIIFGWFGGWNGGGASASSALMGLPDSVDMLSIWGPWHPLTEKQMADMKQVQTIKGTKVLACIFTPIIGADLTPEGMTREEYWGWHATNVDMQEAATRKYAQAIVAEVLKWGYDGLDIDNEPEKTSIYGNVRLFSAFVEEVGKVIGPCAETEEGKAKIFALDGYHNSGLTKVMGKYFTYFISQAYYCRSYSNLDSRFSDLAKQYPDIPLEKLAKMFIVTEDMERYTTSGGEAFTDRKGNRMPSAVGMAGWKPQVDGKDHQKGGSGMYHMENDYANPLGPYYYLRQCATIQNIVNE